MARKESVTYEDLLNAAFNMTREQGISEVTARKLATYTGCSTQPIFRHFENMEECHDCVFDEALKFFDKFYDDFPIKSLVPFVNLGLAYIAFAMAEPNLFAFLFAMPNNKGMNMYSLLNARNNIVINEMNIAKREGVSRPEQIFMKMWMLIHGAACMTLTKDFDLNEAETKKQLEEAYRAFIK